jgi:hypothetical protein
MKVWKLADPRITNENALVITKEASWWFVDHPEVESGVALRKDDPHPPRPRVAGRDVRLL